MYGIEFSPHKYIFVIFCLLFLRNMPIILLSLMNAREKIRHFIAEYKKGKYCVHCGIDDPIVLDFHHVRDKTISISDISRMKWGVKRTLEELEKCIVLCANCHRREHNQNMV